MKHYSGVVRDGVPYKWPNTSQLVQYGWPYLNGDELPPGVPPPGPPKDKPRKRFRNPTTQPGYRPVKTGIQLWAKAFSEPTTLPGRLALTTGRVVWDEPLPVQVNFLAVRAVNAQDQRILMTFPGDYQLFCGAECVNEMKEGGNECPEEMLPEGTACINKKKVLDCCARRKGFQPLERVPNDQRPGVLRGRGASPGVVSHRA